MLIYFDSVIDRHPTASLKWERYMDQDIIPLRVADMDFRSPPAVIDSLIKRIDHGNNSLQDEALVQEIINRNIALTVCPLSNKALQVVPNLENHPLKKMMDLGMKVTVNSDDPAYFGGQLNQNFVEIQKALHLTKKDIYELAKNSFEYALLDKKTKLNYLNELDAFYAKNM